MVLGNTLGSLANATSQALLKQTESTLATMAFAAEAQSLGLTGFAGQVFTTTGATIAKQFEDNLVTAVSTGDYSKLLNAFDPAQIATSLGTAAGSILGKDLAGDVISPASVGQVCWLRTAAASGPTSASPERSSWHRP